MLPNRSESRPWGVPLRDAIAALPLRRTSGRATPLSAPLTRLPQLQFRLAVAARGKVTPGCGHGEGSSRTSQPWGWTRWVGALPALFPGQKRLSPLTPHPAEGDPAGCHCHAAFYTQCCSALSSFSLFCLLLQIRLGELSIKRRSRKLERLKQKNTWKKLKDL